MLCLKDFLVQVTRQQKGTTACWIRSRLCAGWKRTSQPSEETRAGSLCLDRGPGPRASACSPCLTTLRVRKNQCTKSPLTLWVWVIWTYTARMWKGRDSWEPIIVGNQVGALEAETLMVMKPFMVSSRSIQLSFTGRNAWINLWILWIIQPTRDSYS